jgi:two-component system, NarL family, invasion response regulator UvrY
MRILLIEDHPIVRTACRLMLQARPGVEVAEATTAASGLDMAGTFSPDLVLLDLRLPDGNGLDLLATLISTQPNQKIIVFSMYEDPAIARRALEAGARGYITKNDNPDVILEAIDRVGDGGIFLAPGMADKIAEMMAGLDGDPLRSLSPRERQVLELLGRGRTLGYRLSAYAASQIKVKLQIPSTAALIKWATDHLPPPPGIS